MLEQSPKDHSKISFTSLPFLPISVFVSVWQFRYICSHIWQFRYVCEKIPFFCLFLFFTEHEFWMKLFNFYTICFANFLVVQWLGLHTLTAKDPGSVPGLRIKILQAEWYSQKKKVHFKFKYSSWLVLTWIGIIFKFT